MNIFILSWILENCAKFHCDKHVVKMILETTQLASTTHHVTTPDVAEKLTVEGKIYRKTHQNHPCTIWARECKENYIWLCHLGLELCKEYAYRYDKKPEDHKCYSMLLFLIHNVPPLPDNNGVITLPRLAMPDKYKSEDPVTSYRTYYLNDKKEMLVWRKRSPPSWVPKNMRYIHYQSEIKRLSNELSKLNKKVKKTGDHIVLIKQLEIDINKLQTKYESVCK